MKLPLKNPYRPFIEAHRSLTEPIPKTPKSRRHLVASVTISAHQPCLVGLVVRIWGAWGLHC